ncbi:Ubiquinone/menaquinone biosynthesis C-methylase UbiE [Hymenobacter daecheongensis DSM 21074]|uniref:Ubiquinone/menaquinone biosynthesis C-methylase UbiE n=1 Tax=Hymenobacter daecheongensis DSM 21074 TaxID=1121955 RepID=A0A1M6CAT8_9BACT|nr:methyltransferase domain-containing protein [Hymenobacter daecheongensis]SHI57904.1 Ubiquinone/menaquinone biosynthesis C-methylase UbiE [Hymenobacter daecheongensis DSM 21074]
MPTPIRTAKEQFDRQAAHYNAQWNAWTEASLHWLLTHAACQPTDEVLDVATGTGFTALAFAPYVQSVVGLDVSEGMLAQARRKQAELGLANVRWQEGAAEALPFPDGAFSLVTCRIAPHHFDSVPRFLAEVARVLRPGGRLLLADTTVPDDDPATAAWQNRVEALRDPSHRRNLPPREWRQQLEAAGLRVAEMAAPGGEVPMRLGEWLEKAGCQPEQAAEVRTAFAAASPTAKAAFQIQPLADDDFTFVWQRLVVKATKA